MADLEGVIVGVTTKKYKSCASDIPAQAKLCSVCKGYQTAWRNNLFFAAGLTTLLTFVAGAFTFSVNRGTQLYRTFFWHDDVKVLDLTEELLETGPLKIILSNGGDGPVFANEIVVYSPVGGFFRRRIDRLIAPNTVELIEANNIEDDQSHWIINKTGWPNRPMIDSITAFTKHCLLPVAYDANNSNLKRVQDHFDKTQLGPNKRRLALQPSKGTLLYFSVHSRSVIESSFPVTIAFMRSDTTACKDVAVD